MISRRSKPPQPPSPPPVCGRVLASSSQYNSRLGSSPTFFNTGSSSASSSPLMSPNSSGYFSHPSSPGYSSAFSSPVRPQQPPPQQQQQLQRSESDVNFSPSNVSVISTAVSHYLAITSRVQ